MKTNFRRKDEAGSTNKSTSDFTEKEKKNLTREEFENHLSQSGAAGSFMVFRSKKKSDELGLDEL